MKQKADDDEAFSAMVHRHAAFLYRVAFSLLRNGPDAEDAVQEALLKLYRSGSWREMADERAFLARVVWRVGLDRRNTLAAKALRHAEDVNGLELASSAKGPEEIAMETAQHTRMRQLIEELPEEFRQALVLSAIEGMRGSEVAAVLGVPEATVRTRVLRAKERLRLAFQSSGAIRVEVQP